MTVGQAVRTGHSTVASRAMEQTALYIITLDGAETYQCNEMNGQTERENGEREREGPGERERDHS